MNSHENSINALINLLHSWVPLSTQFRTSLSLSMRHQPVKAKEKLYELGSHVHYAWYSVDCWAAQYRTLFTGRVEVDQIFRPGDIFTDIHSFLKGIQSTLSTYIIQGDMLLSISRDAFFNLKDQSETHELLQYYQLAQKENDIWRMTVLSLSDTAKVAAFAKQYPLDILPGHICASYLRMTRSRYSAAKTDYIHTEK